MKIFLRLILSYFITVGAIKLMGKRQLGEFQAGELVVALFISDIATNSVTNPDVPLISCILPATTLVALEIICSFAAARFPLFKRIFDTRPTVLIKDGRLIPGALMKNRITPEELMSQLRLCGVFDPSTVDCAILEPSGSLSVKLKTKERPASAKDVTAVLAAFSGKEGPEPHFDPEGTSRAVIVDGEVMDASLRELKKSGEWLKRTLKASGARSPADVFLLTADEYGSVFFAGKEEDKKQKDPAKDPELRRQK